MKNIISYEQESLKFQIAENSKRIDIWLKELREVAHRMEREVAEMKMKKQKAIA